MCKTKRHYKLRCTVRDRRLPPRLNRILPSAGLLRGVRWFKTDVSGLPIRPIFKGQDQDVHVSSWTSWPLKTWRIRSPETSVLNHLTPRNNPEDGRIHVVIPTNASPDSYSMAYRRKLPRLYNVYKLNWNNRQFDMILNNAVIPTAPPSTYLINTSAVISVVHVSAAISWQGYSYKHNIQIVAWLHTFRSWLQWQHKKEGFRNASLNWKRLT